MVLFDNKLADHNSRKKTLTAINVINHALIVFVTSYILYLAWPLTDPTSLHAFLCTFGSIMLMSEAIMALAGDNAWSGRLKHRTSSRVHWMLQVAGIVCTVSGIVVKLEPPQEGAVADPSLFGRLHVPLGLMSVGGILLASLSGLPALYAAKLRKTIRPEYAKLAHNCFGIVCFLLGVGAQCVAYGSNWLELRSPRMPYVLGLLTGLIAVFTLVGASVQIRHQFRATLNSLSR